MDSKGNVRRVFLACVLHALGSNPAGVRVFRNCASKGHLPLVKVTFAEFFWLVFCMPWAGILLAFKFRNCASKGHLPMVLLAGEESHGRYHCCFLWIPKVTFGEFFWLVFCMPWARILLAFECFGTVPPRDIWHW